MRTEYDSEKRLAVVMYGGVSLAIYIGGVAKELLNVVRATAPSPRDPNAAGLADGQLTPVEKIYRRIASEEGVLKKRITIDVISGTSAGGINGIFLAKALANDLSMDRILRLWVEEGDLAKLLNDTESVAGTGLSPDDPPVALLNGRRMYAKLVDAFDGMDRDAGAKHTARFDASRVDLFVTLTDIRGETIRLPVENTVARERRHRQRFHFTSDPPGANELSEADNPLLAFAARCTSSFPVAFEPFTWDDAVGISAARAGATEWTKRLMFVGDDYRQRPFGDGGYLDNKPFSYAIDELARRQSHLPVERTLIYVEPDPETLASAQEARRQAEKPDAIENAVTALTISGYETIREDLERVVERNRRISQLVELEGIVEHTLASHGAEAKKPLSADEWMATQGPGKLVEKYGIGYPAYHKFKVDSVIEAIADTVCSAGSIGRPELAQVIRDLVTAWVRKVYPSFADEQKLLLDADIDYRMRKISFVLRRAGPGRRDRVAEACRTLKEAYDALYALRKKMREQFDVQVRALRGSVLTDTVLASFDNLRGADRAAEIGRLVASTPAVGELKKYLENILGPSVKDISDGASAALRVDDGEIRPLREAYEEFETYDMVMYPIVRHGAVDEAVEVKVVRVSPDDIDPKRRNRLAGARLG
ncbi:MAG: patatin-like protein, partial [Myxococcales bacterium]